jgi:hypothetical protein
LRTEGLRCRQIAAALSISLVTVSMLLGRSSERLMRKTGSRPGEKIFFVSNWPEFVQILHAFIQKMERASASLPRVPLILD